MVQVASPLSLPSDPGPATIDYEAFLALPEAERRIVALRVLEGEYALEGDDRRRAVLARLRAWLALKEDDARTVIAAFESAAASLSLAREQARLEAERLAVVNGLRFSEFRALAKVYPWLRTWDVPGVEDGQQDEDRTLALVAAIFTRR